MIKKLITRVKTFAQKALIKTVYDDKAIQLVKVTGLLDDVKDKIERIQNYGLTSNPPNDSESIILCLSGSADNGIVIVVDNGSYRIKNLSSGEVAIYSQFGQIILLDKNGDIVTTQTVFKVGNGSSAVAKAITNDQLWQKLFTVFSAWIPTAAPTIDNGASLKAAFMAAFGNGPESTASNNLKAD